MHLPIRTGASGATAARRSPGVSGPKILLVIGGGIAAYKSCELVRLIRKAGGEVTCVLTKGGQQFVTPMALAALSENKVYTSLFDLKDEVEMGHIQLSREADLVVVCPATADLLAKMAAGIADDLATTLILATDKPVLTVPAMNVRMWEHSATQRNADWLRQAGVAVMDPDEGAMACGEFGAGRMPEPPSILARIAQELDLDLDLPELGAPVPAQLAAPAQSVPLGETLEPSEPMFEDVGEEEDDTPSGGGLGGLLSMIIPRTTETRTHEEIEAELEELPEAGDEAGFEGAELPEPSRTRSRRRTDPGDQGQGFGSPADRSRGVGLRRRWPRDAAGHGRRLPDTGRSLRSFAAGGTGGVRSRSRTPAALWQACAHHRGPDARTDRSGALYCQPVKREAGLCHRRDGRSGGGPRYSDRRTCAPAHPGRGRPYRRRDRRRHGRGSAPRIAGGYRLHGRRGCGLEEPACRGREDEETRLGAARADPRGEPRYSLPARRRVASARHC